MAVHGVERVVGEREGERVGVLKLDLVLHALPFRLFAGFRENVGASRRVFDTDNRRDVGPEPDCDGARPAPDVEQSVGRSEQWQQVCGRIGCGSRAMRAEDCLVMATRVEWLVGHGVAICKLGFGAPRAVETESRSRYRQAVDGEGVREG